MEKSGFRKIVKEYLPYVIAIIIVILVKTFIISPIIVNGTSMDSTLKNGDLMILNKIEYLTSDIERFDIVVIKHDDKHIIKRVIGMPGDTVACVDNVLYINDEVVNEPYLDEGTITTDFYVAKIPEDKYFVLGDNRRVSLDSRSIGLINKSDIEGHATITLFPFNRFGTKK